ncbi:MAG: hypothetical protein COA79_17800 [Planctomycetota bacterium]|nr:MAG: hypothetical protein COA79_17800 [Planctomycetota bacterium]
MKPTIENYSYGPHERNVFDIYLADSKKPTPFIFIVHGGGFMQGDKARILDQVPLEEMLSSGISAFTTNYRLTNEGPFPMQMLDCAKALQTIRHNAGNWNLDNNRVAASGGSAGSGISQWLAYSDDLADPNSSDPIARQSTKLTCLVLMQAQSTYDPRIIKEIVPGNAYDHVAMKRLFGVADDFNWNEDEIPQESIDRIEACGPITLLNEKAPPLLVKYNKHQKIPGDVHHSNMGKYLKEKTDQLGVDCTVVMDTDYEHGNEGFKKDFLQFLKKHFNLN